MPVRHEDTLVSSQIQDRLRGGRHLRWGLKEKNQDRLRGGRHLRWGLREKKVMMKMQRSKTAKEKLGIRTGTSGVSAPRGNFSFPTEGLHPEEIDVRQNPGSGDPSWRPDILGWSAGILDLYRQQAKDMSDGSRCVEVGVYHGRSLLFLANELWKLRKTACVVTGVDPGAYYDNAHETLLANLASVRARWEGAAGPTIEIVRDYSSRAAREVPDKSLDMCFIDADHGEAAVENDIQCWLPKMKPGSIMAGHDYLFPNTPGVALAVHKIFPRERVSNEYEWVWKVRIE
jgi:hypothetical protein